MSIPAPADFSQLSPATVEQLDHMARRLSRVPLLRTAFRKRIVHPHTMLTLLANHLESVAMMLDAASVAMGASGFDEALQRVLGASAVLRGLARSEPIIVRRPDVGEPSGGSEPDR